LIVIPISSETAEPWLLKRHYAQRLCPVTYAFGAYENSILLGVVTFGVPFSPQLKTGICGEDWKNNVLELNRLCCESRKNLASHLVGSALRCLPKPSVVVSFADTEQGHVGYIYQATNFIYTGLSAKRSNWKIKGKEHLHSGTIADLSRGKKDRAEWMRKEFGSNFYLEERSRKHRYVYFCGSRSQKKKMRSALRYEVESYPKGETQRYNADASINNQLILL